MIHPKIKPAKLPQVCRERAAHFGDLRQAGLTAIALDQAADEIERLRALLVRAQVNVPEFYATWHRDAALILNGE